MHARSFFYLYSRQLTKRQLTKTRVTLDDPGGHRSRFDRIYGRTTRVSPELIRSRIFHKTNSIYDFELKVYGRDFYLDILNSSEYDMKTLQAICDSLNKWMVAHVVRNAIEEISEESIERAFSVHGRYSIPLGVSESRFVEFDGF